MTPRSQGRHRYLAAVLALPLLILNAWIVSGGAARTEACSRRLRRLTSATYLSRVDRGPKGYPADRTR